MAAATSIVAFKLEELGGLMPIGGLGRPAIRLLELGGRPRGGGEAAPLSSCDMSMAGRSVQDDCGRGRRGGGPPRPGPAPARGGGGRAGLCSSVLDAAVMGEEAMGEAARGEEVGGEAVTAGCSTGAAGLGASGPGSPGLRALKMAFDSANPLSALLRISDSLSSRRSQSLQCRYRPQLVVSTPVTFLLTMAIVSATVASSKEGMVLNSVGSV